MKTSIPKFLPRFPTSLKRGVVVSTIAAATLAAGFVALALLQHFNYLHMSGGMGDFFAHSGKGIMGALHTVQHHLATDKTTQAIVITASCVLAAMGLSTLFIRYYRSHTLSRKTWEK